MKNIKIKKLNNYEYINKSQSYKRGNKIKNKIQKSNKDNFKGVNSFIYISTNLNNKNANKELKRNSTTVKLNRNIISANNFSKIFLSINKKNGNKDKNNN